MPQPAPTTRELSRLMKYYNEKIKPHSKSQCVGVLRNIQRLLASGTALEDIALALENYANDPWRKANDLRYTKAIRSFFMPDVIAEWQTPRPQFVKPGLPEIQFMPTVQPSPVTVTPSPEEESNDL